MNEWISVEDRLPCGVLVLAYRPFNKREPVASIFYDCYTKKFGGSSVVTHWMPLPPPPAQEQSK